MTVTVYKNNKLDQAEEVEPEELAREFIATVRSEQNPEHSRMGRPHLELEYRWFLTGQPRCICWHEEDWPAIEGALTSLMDGDERIDKDVFAWLTEVVR